MEAIKLNTSFTSPLQPQDNKMLDKVDAKDNKTFSKWLEDSMGQVNTMQQQADIAAQNLISGESSDVHGTMIAMEKSSIAFNLVMQVRNKIINAYEEIQRMSI